MITWSEIAEFLDRPRGGMELEICFAFAEVWFGSTLIISPGGLALWNTAALQDFYGVKGAQAVGVPWLLAGSFTFVGLCYYRMGKPVCALLRFIGAFLSCWLWGWLAIVSGAIVVGLLPALGLYVAGFIAGIRIMFSAWRRWQRES
jgi:hypothetical protein